MNSSTSVTEINVVKTAVFVILTALLAMLSVSCFYYYNFGANISASHERWGQFGDFFGGMLNPLLGFLSLMTILGAMYLQSRELSNSTQALKDQSYQLKVQAFDGAFFYLFDSYVKSLNDIVYVSHVSSEVRGELAFKELYKSLEAIYNSEVSMAIKESEVSERDDIENIKDSYNRFFNKYQNQYISALRKLDQVLMFVEVRGMGNEEYYYDVIFSQISSYEMVIMFYHYLCFLGAENALFSKNRNFIFSRIDSGLLFDQESHSKYIGE